MSEVAYASQSFVGISCHSQFPNSDLLGSRQATSRRDNRLDFLGSGRQEDRNLICTDLALDLGM